MDEPPQKDATKVSRYHVAAFLFGALLIAFVVGQTYVGARRDVTTLELNKFLLALGAAGVGASFTGFLRVQLKLLGGGLIDAGGGLAIFVLVFFFYDTTPAPLAALSTSQLDELSGMVRDLNDIHNGQAGILIQLDSRCDDGGDASFVLLPGEQERAQGMGPDLESTMKELLESTEMLIERLEGWTSHKGDELVIGLEKDMKARRRILEGFLGSKGQPVKRSTVCPSVREYEALHERATSYQGIYAELKKARGL